MELITEILLVVFLIAILIHIATPWVRDYIISKKWQKTIDLIDSYYRLINPYQISIKNRQSLLKTQDHSLTYGEVNLTTFMKLLNKLKPEPEKAFFDLGSGVGKCVFAAALQFKLQALGFEILEDLHNISQDTLNKFRHDHPENSELIIEFYHANIFDIDISDADFILLNATSWSGEAWQRLVQKLKTMQGLAHIIITSKTLPSDAFKEVYSGMEMMSWGLTHTYIYQKKANFVFQDIDFDNLP